MKTIKILTACAAAFLFCQISKADLIKFNDGIELGGSNVEVLSSDGEYVKVKVKYGTVTLNANRIKSIKVDFEERIQSLVNNGTDTPNNLFNLAVLCDQYQMTKEAEQAYVLTLRKKDLPDELLRKLAGVFEQRKMWPEAKKAYDQLLATNPADAHLQQKAALCAEMAKGAEPAVVDVKIGNTDDTNTKTVEATNDQGTEPTDDTGTDTAQQPDDKPAAPATRDGFEANNLWRAEAWGNSSTCEIVTPEDQGDNKMLSVHWTERDKDKVAIRLNVDMDLTNKKSVTFDIYNEGNTPAGICVAFNTLPGYQFFESFALNSQVKKWVPVEIDLASKKFKSAATNWTYHADIANKDNVKDMFILIYNRDTEGSLFIDNIRFHDK